MDCPLELVNEKSGAKKSLRGAGIFPEVVAPVCARLSQIQAALAIRIANANASQLRVDNDCMQAIVTDMTGVDPGTLS